MMTMLLFIIYVATGLETILGGRNNIDDVMYVTTVGLDKIDDETVQMTVVTKQYAPEEETSALAKKDQYFVSRGKDMFDANRNFHEFMDKDVFWGHLDFIIVSEELANKDIDSALDYFIRGHENKLTAKVLISKGASAEEVIKEIVDKGEDITSLLNVLSKGISALSVSSELKLTGAFNKINNQYCSCYIPTIELVEDEASVKENDEDPKRKLMMDGYAFFDQDDASLLCFIQGSRARGFNFLKNKIVSGVITVLDPEGEKVTLEIISSKTKILPEFKNDELVVKIVNETTSNIVEVNGTMNIFVHEIIESLIQQQNDIIESEMQSVINLSNEYESDLFDLSSIITHEYPLRWNEIKEKWRSEFLNVRYEIEVESNINRTYVITKPSLYREE